MFLALAYKHETQVGNEGRMSSAAGRNGETFRGGALIPVLFFITPLFTAAAPRLAPFFLPIVAFVLIVAALRRGLPWRELLRPNAAMAALIAVALYAGLSAIWAEDPDGALSKAAFLIAATLVVFAASVAIATLDRDQVRRASLAFRRRRAVRRRLRRHRTSHRRRAHPLRDEHDPGVQARTAPSM